MSLDGWFMVGGLGCCQLISTVEEKKDGEAPSRKTTPHGDELKELADGVYRVRVAQRGCSALTAVPSGPGGSVVGQELIAWEVRALLVFCSGHKRVLYVHCIRKLCRFWLARQWLVGSRVGAVV